MNRIVNAADEAVVFWPWCVTHGRQRYIDIVHQEVVVRNGMWDMIVRVYVEGGIVHSSVTHMQTSMEVRFVRIVGNHSVGSKDVMWDDLWASIEIRFVGVVRSYVDSGFIEESRVARHCRDAEITRMGIDGCLGKTFCVNIHVFSVFWSIAEYDRDRVRRNSGILMRHGRITKHIVINFWHRRVNVWRSRHVGMADIIEGRMRTKSLAKDG